MKTSKKPDIPYIMSVLADLFSKQYGVEITITCTPKEKKALDTSMEQGRPGAEDRNSKTSAEDN